MHKNKHTKTGLLVPEFFCTRIAVQLEGRGKAGSTILPPAQKNQYNGLTQCIHLFLQY